MPDTPATPPAQPAKPNRFRKGRMLEAALAYAARGFKVFPCHTPKVTADVGDPTCSCGRDDCQNIGKHPRTKNGLKDATNDPAKVTEFWHEWPMANIGLVTSSEYVVIDIDEHGENNDDALAYERTLPRTATVITGSGRHYYFRNPSGQSIRCSTSGLAVGVDVRAEGGYVIAPPSLHRSGREYVWDEGSASPLDVGEEFPFANVTAELLAQLMRARSNAAAAGRRSTGEPKPSRGADEYIKGGRNAALTARAGQMRRSGFDEAAILAALLMENEQRCKPPLDTKEVERIARSVARYEPGDREAAAGPAEAAARAVAQEEAGFVDDDPSWQEELIRKKNGKLEGSFHNIYLIVKHSPRFADLWLDEMSQAPLIGERKVEDGDISDFRYEVEHEWRIEWAVEKVKSAIHAIARKRKRHPVRELLNGLTWDGVKRIDGIPSRCLGVDDAMSKRLYRNFLISAVARALEPGCQVDTMLILVGDQGAFKSRFFRAHATFPDHYRHYFSDSVMDLKSKDAYMQLHSAWIYEWGEIDEVMRSYEKTLVKKFITSREDTFRPPYAASVGVFPRSGVLVGSTNKSQFLVDETGSRRSNIIEIPKGVVVDLEYLKENLVQLWAEAVAAYKAGEHWYLDKHEDKQREEEAQDRHMVEDPWRQAIEKWLKRAPAMFAISDVLREAVGLEVKEMGRAHEGRAAALLVGFGYSHGKVWVPAEKKSRWFWRLSPVVSREPGEEG